MQKVDTDWYSPDREKVKQYLFNKQALHCCDIVTFNTIALKGAIRDVGRALDIPLSEVNIICNKVDNNEDEMRKKYKELFKYVDLLNGVVVSVGNHPAGCVVSPVDVEEYFGTFTTSTDNYPISVLNMKEIDKLNFVKLDILALDNVGLINKTCETANIEYATPDNIPPDDMNVWKSIINDTTLIFQWESKSASKYIKKLMSSSTIEKLKKFNPQLTYMELFSIGNGALRPAGESYRDRLANGECQDNGNDELNEAFKKTFGYIIFQEDIISFLHNYCGFTMGEADVVRRGFAKKTGTEQFIPKIKEGFEKTMLSKGVEPTESEKIITSFIKVIEDASSYLFSKNHADPYSWIGYICGYLRYYYPLEFITTALNIFNDKEEKTAEIIGYAKRNGIKISPIKFRHSLSNYTFDKSANEIFKGIQSIKYMNGSVATELYELKDNRYNTFIDLLFDIENKTTLNSRQKEILIKLNFFDEFGDANNLLKMNELFELLHEKSQIKKKKIDELDFDKNIFRKNSLKETECTFSGIDSHKILNEMCDSVNETKQSLVQRVKAEVDYLGYVDVVDEKYAKMLAILDIDDKFSPRLKVCALKNGNVFDCKIKKETYKKWDLGKGDVIKVAEQIRKPKQVMGDDGKFHHSPDELELWILELQNCTTTFSTKK